MKRKLVVLCSILLVICFSFLLSNVALAQTWTAPTEQPPGGNVSAPLNVNNSTQLKAGKLGIGAGANPDLPLYQTYGLNPYLDVLGDSLANRLVSFIDSFFALSSTSKVGVGTLTPAAKLDVVGDIKASADICSTMPDGVTVKCLNSVGAGALPSGTVSQTLRHDGTGWAANSAILSNGTDVAIGDTTIPADPSVRLYVAARPGRDAMMVEGASTGSGGDALEVNSYGTGIGLQIYSEDSFGALINVDDHIGLSVENNSRTGTPGPTIDAKNIGLGDGVWGGATGASASAVKATHYGSGYGFRQTVSGGGSVKNRFDSRLGIGVEPSSANMLHVAGKIQADGGDVCTSLNGGRCLSTVSGSSLPSGALDQTLRYDGTTWVANGSLLNNGTNVGIGATPTSAGSGSGFKLNVSGSGSIGGIGISATNGFGVDANSSVIAVKGTGVSSGTGVQGTSTGGTGVSGSSTSGTGVSGNSNSGTGVFAGNTDNVSAKALHVSQGGTAFGVYQDGASSKNYFQGRVGLGTINPAATLDIIGTLKLQGNGAGSDKVLTSDADGDATWQTAPGAKTYVGATVSTYVGSAVGGYAGGDAKCVTAFGSGSRMATAADFVNGRPATSGWYSTFVWAEDAGGMDLNDCRGWTVGSGVSDGAAMWGASGFPQTSLCSTAQRILCVQ